MQRVTVSDELFGRAKGDPPPKNYTAEVLSSFISTAEGVTVRGYVFDGPASCPGPQIVTEDSVFFRGIEANGLAVESFDDNAIPPHSLDVRLRCTVGTADAPHTPYNLASAIIVMVEELHGLSGADEVRRALGQAHQWLEDEELANQADPTVSPALMHPAPLG